MQIRQSRAVKDRPRKGEHLVQRSRLFLIKDGISTPSLSPGANSSLLLFNVPVTDVSIVSSKWVDYGPVQTGTDPIEFVIKPLADYIDTNKTELRLVVKITKQDGSPTWDGKKYTLVNNALHSIIKQFTINGKIVLRNW